MNRTPSRRWPTLALGTLILALGMVTGPVHADETLAKPTRLLVGAPPGGSLDIVARRYGELLSREIGSPVYVENKPGASGLLSVRELLAAPADGRTLMVGPSSLAVEIPFTIRWPLDTLKELQPVVELGRTGLILLTSPQTGVRRFPELATALRSTPTAWTYASYSAGTYSHLMGWELSQWLQVPMPHVAYKGSPPALHDLMANAVTLMFDAPPTALPLIRSGRLVPLATTGRQRHPALPDLPTLTELGAPSLAAEVSVLVWAAAATPPGTLERVRRVAVRVGESQAMRDQMGQLGLAVRDTVAPQQLTESLRREAAEHQHRLRRIGFQPE